MKTNDELKEKTDINDKYRINISYLLDIYGSLLTEKCRTEMEYYFHDDLSLSEIAEIAGTTRQGVRDNLKRGEAILLDYEEKLNFLTFSAYLSENMNQITERMNYIRTVAMRRTLPEDVIECIDDVVNIAQELKDR